MAYYTGRSDRRNDRLGAFDLFDKVRQTVAKTTAVPVVDTVSAKIFSAPTSPTGTVPVRIMSAPTAPTPTPIPMTPLLTTATPLAPTEPAPTSPIPSGGTGTTAVRTITAPESPTAEPIPTNTSPISMPSSGGGSSGGTGTPGSASPFSPFVSPSTNPAANGEPSPLTSGELFNEDGTPVVKPVVQQANIFDRFNALPLGVKAAILVGSYFLFGSGKHGR